MPDAVLFDCDGVLVDSEPASARAWHRVLTSFGVEGFDHRIWVGRTDREVADHHAPLVGVDTRTLEEAAESALIDELGGGVRRFDDGVAAYRISQKMGIPTAVVTNSSRRRLDAILAAANLDVALALCADDVSRPKPFPDIYLAAASVLGVAAGGCLVFEDSASGVSSALAAGMQVIVVDRGELAAGPPGLPTTTDVSAALAGRLGLGNLA